MRTGACEDQGTSQWSRVHRYKMRDRIDWL